MRGLPRPGRNVGLFGLHRTEQDVKRWVDQHWDHGFLVNDRDECLVQALRAVPNSKVYLFSGINPSAEAIARALVDVVQQRFGAVVRGVRIWESLSQYAEYSQDDAAVPVRAAQL